MAAALREAAKGLGDTSPNPAVGAVIVRKGRVVARGHHRRFGGPHAGVEALRDAERRGAPLRGATMAVTLEPCDHFGKTPPCTRAILQAGLRRVLVGTLDPHAIVSGRGVRRLRRAGVRVQVLDDPRVHSFYAPYRTFHQAGRCYVTLKLAVSTDGKITHRRGRPSWITGPESRAEVQRIRSRVDAILVGRRTAEIDNPRLTIRSPFATGRRRTAARIVLSGRGQVRRDLRIFRDGHAPAWVMSDSPDRLVRRLAQRGIVHLLVEGGAQTARSFLKAGLVDEILLFASPKVIGHGGLGAFGERHIDPPLSPLVKGGKNWRLTGEKKFGKDILLRFSPM